jgi:phosphate/sulfate permease
MNPHDYVWLFVLGIILAFADGFGIGANDVANSFSTSVSSKSLTLKQACIIAIFAEFLGAFLLGANTTDTIKGKLIKVTLFTKNPELLMLAMVCALIGSSSWTIFASFLGWPVSTTHSIVGAIIGSGIAVFGFRVVDWSYKGFGKIIASWFISPVAAGIVAAIIFLFTKFLVLERQNSFERGLQIIPLYFGLTAMINVFFIFYKGSPRLSLSKLNVGIVFGIAFAVAAVLVAFCYLCFIPFMRRRIVDNEDLKWYHGLYMPLVKKQPTRTGPVREGFNASGDAAPKDEEAAEGAPEAEPEKARALGAFGKVKKVALSGVNHDVVNHHGNERIMAVHDHAKKYDDNTEILYSFLQILTATLASFAHGSNDVSNAVAPLSVIYDVWRTGKVVSKAPVQLWVLALGGIAIDVGLVTLGWRVFQALGNQITYHSPSRGFSMELGSALTVLTASKIGVPVSTTQCITGATIGVGLCGGNIRSINWRKFAMIFFSWLVTVPVAATISGLVMYFGARAPKA